MSLFVLWSFASLNYHALTDVDSGKVQAALVLCLLSPDS